MKFFNWWYRGRKIQRRYIRARDALNLCAAVLAGILATIAYSTKPTLTVVTGVLYIGIVVITGVATVKSRTARDRVQAEVLWGLFSMINKEVFQGEHRTRFTLFQEVPFGRFHGHYIVPCYRYFKGGDGPIEEADRSLARYKRGEGLTGQAWAEAGRNLLVLVMPKFQNRQQFEDHYINQLHVAPETVHDLSDHMVNVQTIFCYAFVGDRDRTLGVLSLDLEAL